MSKIAAALPRLTVTLHPLANHSLASNRVTTRALKLRHYPGPACLAIQNFPYFPSLWRWPCKLAWHSISMVATHETKGETMKNTVQTFLKAKQEKKKLTMLTAYDYSMAKIMDAAGINSILVGDSLGMVCLGYKDTLAVTMEDMLHHTKAVARGVESALLITDMPFMSYQTSVYDALCNAGRLVKEGGAHAVKLEGGDAVCPQIRALVDASIPVCAHIGLTPQSVNAFGGFKVQGKDEAGARRILDAAKAVEQAGAFAVVLECIPAQLAAIVTDSISIPTIGIGAGNSCDGQVLVYQDMLGLFSDFTPKFAKHFANLGLQIRAAFEMYISEVEQGCFPAKEHEFSLADDVLRKLY